MFYISQVKVGMGQFQAGQKLYQVYIVYFWVINVLGRPIPKLTSLPPEPLPRNKILVTVEIVFSTIFDRRNYLYIK